MDLPPGQLPQTNEEMKGLLDRISRWLNRAPTAAR
jgi:hypothetical protein